MKAGYFGVRHLSPVCGYYVKEFLDRTAPDIVLIEGPSDLSDMIPKIYADNVRFPVALLAYTAEEPVRSIMYPLAEYSPEYNAMKWAVEHHVEVRFCDLPTGAMLFKSVSDDMAKEKEAEEENISVYDKIEQITGLDDETFWEYTFEQSEIYDDLISALAEYGRNIRELSECDEYTLLRESFMRKSIYECSKDHSCIAVITGAFHTEGIKAEYSAEDEKRISKMQTVTAKATLMPYSYYKLSSRSGYGAGNKAPFYYEMLWYNRLKGDLKRTCTEYLSRLAAFQRSQGYCTSSAEVIEAERLAYTLSSIRNGRLPSLSDLRDSALTCLGHGDPAEISTARADTEIGTVIGSLPEGVVNTGVQEDFIRQLKGLKLERFRKITAEELELDLRENLRVRSEKSAFLGLYRSFFLHRLSICGIGFAQQEQRYQDSATWAEKWMLRWTPETEIEIVEASLNGNTVEEAARYVIDSGLAEGATLEKCALALADAYMCGLESCIKTAAAAVGDMCAESSSPADEGKVISSLSASVRFGSIRKLDTSNVEPLLEKLYLRFILQVQTAAVCGDEAAKQLNTALTCVYEAVCVHAFLDEKQFLDVLLSIADSDMVNPLISGHACALLCEWGKISNDKVSELISRRLSHGTPPADAAAWFEGLSSRSHRMLIGRISLWERLCGFIGELSDEEFKPVLVALRRTFSEYSAGEKAEIAENIGEVLGISSRAAAEIINAQITEEEQKAIDELDDFDFGDI